MDLPDARPKGCLRVTLKTAGVIRVALLIVARFTYQADRGLDVGLSMLHKKQTEPSQQVPVLLPIGLDVLEAGAGESPPVYDRQMPVRRDLEVPDVQFKGHLNRFIRRRHRQCAAVIARLCRGRHMNLDPERLGLIRLDRDLRPLPERIRNACRRFHLQFVFGNARRIPIDVYVSHPPQSDGRGWDDGIPGDMPQIGHPGGYVAVTRARPKHDLRACDLRASGRDVNHALGADLRVVRAQDLGQCIAGPKRAVERFPGRAMQGDEDGCHEQEQSANR